MKKIVLFTLFVALSFQINAQEKINWLSFEEAISKNKENPKQILIHVYTDWCGYCKKMEKETYSNSVIAKFINTNFYPIKLNGEGKKDIEYKGYTFKFQKQGRNGYHELSAALLEGKMSYPTTLFLTEKEKLIQKVPGYLSKEHFEKILAFFATDAYKNEDWEEYQKNFKSNL